MHNTCVISMYVFLCVLCICVYEFNFLSKLKLYRKMTQRMHLDSIISSPQHANNNQGQLVKILAFYQKLQDYDLIKGSIRLEPFLGKGQGNNYLSLVHSMIQYYNIFLQISMMINCARVKETKINQEYGKGPRIPNPDFFPP